MSAWFWLFLSIIGSSVGNVLMKYASQQGTAIINLYNSFPFIIGAMLFGIGLLCYMRALETLPLVIAYPIVVGSSIVLITTMAIYLFDETISYTHVLGVALIFSGLFLLSREVSVA